SNNGIATVIKSGRGAGPKKPANLPETPARWKVRQTRVWKMTWSRTLRPLLLRGFCFIPSPSGGGRRKVPSPARGGGQGGGSKHRGGIGEAVAMSRVRTAA